MGSRSIAIKKTNPPIKYGLLGRTFEVINPIPVTNKPYAATARTVSRKYTIP
jgi:hypothetical protein